MSEAGPIMEYLSQSLKSVKVYGSGSDKRTRRRGILGIVTSPAGQILGLVLSPISAPLLHVQCKETSKCRVERHGPLDLLCSPLRRRRGQRRKYPRQGPCRVEQPTRPPRPWVVLARRPGCSCRGCSRGGCRAQDSLGNVRALKREYPCVYRKTMWYSARSDGKQHAYWASRGGFRRVHPSAVPGGA